MSKFLCLGMDSVSRSGRALRRRETYPAAETSGGCSVGPIGDASVLEVVEGDFDYRDVLGEFCCGHRRLEARGLVVGGRWWYPPRK